MRLALLAFLSITLLSVTQAEAEEIYRLGAGDRLRVTVYGEKDLSGEYEVDGTGSLTLPLVGEVTAGGLSVRELEKTITTAYAGDYLINPRVNAEVMNYRPIFILGEVNDPGHYAYINSMTVLQAVSVAGGYTYRARKNEITVRRTIDDEEQEFAVEETYRIMPGDIIHVNERFF